MNVVHVNTMDAGGAYNAANRLHKGLLSQGVQSRELILYQYKNSDFDIHKTSFLEGISLVPKLTCAVRYRIQECQIRQKRRDLPTAHYSFHISPYDIENHPWVKESDIVNLHWVANFIDYQRFFRNVKNPVIWTLHDENPFSGGFHYDFYQEPSYQQLDQEIIFAKKKSLPKAELLTIVSPSQWLLKRSQKSDLFNEYAHYCIPNGVNTEVFATGKKHLARQSLSLPADKKIVLFVAESIEDKRKGLEIFLNGLAKTDFGDTVLCVIGKNEGLPNNSREGLIFLPFLSGEEQMALAYNAADVFVIPSLVDNFPNTVLEAMACGIPVVGFDAGGIPEMIKDEETGLLARVGNTDELFEKIGILLENDELRNRMGTTARDVALKKYTLERQALQYLKLYDEILSKNKKALFTR